MYEADLEESVTGETRLKLGSLEHATHRLLHLAHTLQLNTCICAHTYVYKHVRACVLYVRVCVLAKYETRSRVSEV